MNGSEEMACPHIDKCKQKISQDSFIALCQGEFTEYEWNQEDCFKYDDLGDEDKRLDLKSLKTPKEWK